MFLRGTKDNNLFQLHTSNPKNQGKTLGGTIQCQLDKTEAVGSALEVQIALLLSTGQEPCLNSSHHLLELAENGSLMVTINSPFCWQSSCLTALLPGWFGSNDCVLWAPLKSRVGPEDGVGLWRIQEEEIQQKKWEHKTDVEDKSNG